MNWNDNRVATLEILVSYKGKRVNLACPIRLKAIDGHMDWVKQQLLEVLDDTNTLSQVFAAIVLHLRDWIVAPAGTAMHEARRIRLMFVDEPMPEDLRWANQGVLVGRNTQN